MGQHVLTEAFKKFACQTNEDGHCWAGDKRYDLNSLRYAGSKFSVIASWLRNSEKVQGQLHEFVQSQATILTNEFFNFCKHFICQNGGAFTSLFIMNIPTLHSSNSRAPLPNLIFTHHTFSKHGFEFSKNLNWAFIFATKKRISHRAYFRTKVKEYEIDELMFKKTL